MTKPVIVLKTDTAPSPLTYNQLDANFINLRDSTINFTGDAGGTRSMDLNDTTQITGAHNIKVTVDEATQKITIDNTLSSYAFDPIGFENVTDATVTFDDATRTLTIAPVGASYNYWWKGKQITVTTSKSVQIPNTSAMYLVYFDDETLTYSTNATPIWNTQVPVSYISWNAVAGQGLFSKETHTISMDWKTKEYIHETQGAQYAEGLNILNYTTTGTGANNTDAQFDISNGVIYDQDIAVAITHSNTPTANTWQQDLQGPARIPVLYHSGSLGGWVRDAQRDYAVKNGTSLVTYNLNTGGNWTTPDVANTEYVAYWIVATNFVNTPVISIMGQRSDNKLLDAQNNNTWSSLDLSYFPAEEFRPLYRIIYRTGTAYANTPKAYIAHVDDFRFSTVIPQGGLMNGVQTVLGTTGRVTSTGGQNPVIDLDVSGITAGSYVAANITVDAYGRITAASDGSPSTSFQTIVAGATSIVADQTNDTLTLTGGTGITITGNATTDTATFALTSGVATAGTYGSATLIPVITVDTYGRITGVTTQTNNNGTVTSVIAGTGLTGGTITTTGTIALATTAVTPGSYTNTNITVDSYGRITAATSGVFNSLSQGNSFIEVADTGTGLITLQVDVATNKITIDQNGFIMYVEKTYNNGNSGSFLRSNGPIQYMTAISNFNFSVSGMVAGMSATILIKQDATGNRIMTSDASYLWAGGNKTLSTTPNAVDVVTIFSTPLGYLCNLAKGYA